MIAIMVGIGISSLTELTKWLKKKWFPNTSIRTVVGLLSLLAGAIYYYFEQSNPAVVEEAIKFATGAFATSQAIWMVVDKLLSEEDLSK